SPGAQAAISPANPRPTTVAPAADRKKLAPRPKANPKAKSKANPNPKADASNQTPKTTAQTPARQRPANVSRQP
ncbi:MAG: hypothetical protein LW833_06875, partial [Hyphomicrobiales bacterium]|nr:hypothetical protein [Hyphomicrobiales bacterium]